MKKYNLHFALCGLLLLTSCLISCEKGKKPTANEGPPKTEDTTAIVKDTTDSKDTAQTSKAAASIIIDDLKILLKWGTGMNNCDCTGAWSSSTSLTNTTANVALPAFNLAGVKPRAIVFCEVTFPNVNTKGTCKLAFDKGCNSLKFRNCATSNITADRKNVRISKNTASINLKPEYDLANSGRFILTPTNCDGCKFRYKVCTGSWLWGDCTSSLNN